MEVVVTDIITYDDFLLLLDNLESITLSLSEIAYFVQFAITISLAIVIVLVIYNTIKHFFY